MNKREDQIHAPPPLFALLYPVHTALPLCALRQRHNAGGRGPLLGGHIAPRYVRLVDLGIVEQPARLS
jgi:hypothetical protein